MNYLNMFMVAGILFNENNANHAQGPHHLYEFHLINNLNNLIIGKDANFYRWYILCLCFNITYTQTYRCSSNIHGG